MTNTHNHDQSDDQHGNDAEFQMRGDLTEAQVVIDYENLPELTTDLLESSPELIAEGCRRKGALEVDVNKIAQLGIARRESISHLDKLRAKANQLQKDAAGQMTSEIRQTLVQLKQDIKDAEARNKHAVLEFEEAYSWIPNLPAPDVPVGPEQANKVISTWGEPRVFDFDPKDHFTLLSDLDLIDMERGAKLAGRGFYFLKGDLYRMRQALALLFTDRLVQQGFVPCTTPVVANDKTLYGTGYLPWAYKDNFRLNEGKLALIGTSEQTLVAQHMDEMLDASALPLRYVADTQCFRTEAGAAGKDTHGIIRVHQFGKVEQIILCHPDESAHWQQIALENETWLLQELNIPHQVVVIASEDMGYPGYKKYDVEAWVPTQNRYRELTSNTNFRSFQSRRLNIRAKDRVTGEKFYPHTISATGFPDRMLVALAENLQTEDGGIAVPKMLQPFLGKKIIS